MRHYTSEEAAAQAYDSYVKDGIVPVPVKRGQPPSSQFKGVTWVKRTLGNGKWKAQRYGKCLGYHATEEAAAQAYDSCVRDGVVPVKHQDGTSSSFKGVSWVRRDGKWGAHCKGKNLGLHSTEEAAAHAYENYVTDGVVAVTHRAPTSSQFKGVTW